MSYCVQIINIEDIRFCQGAQYVVHFGTDSNYYFINFHFFDYTSFTIYNIVTNTYNSPRIYKIEGIK